MKIIQSFWAGNQNETDKNTYGWLAPKYHWLGWVLSVNQLSKFYNVELYTDSIGYEILIKKLNLPYAKVHKIFDDLNTYDKDLWAIAKIKSYELQDTPFLHIDGDVFIWDKFPKHLLEKKLITQNLEVTTKYYKDMWKEISPFLSFIPNEIKAFDQGESNYACNMGIVGGSDITFLKEYSKKSIEFVEKNKDNWVNINGFNFNIFFEQVLFYQMAENEEISYLFSEISKDNEYEGFGNFNDIPHKRNYLHLLGFYKRSMLVCKQLENYVILYYPEYFKKLTNILTKEYSYFENDIEDYFFTKNCNEKLITNFHQNSISPKDSVYLLARDLNSVDQPREYINNIENDISFYIIKVENWELEEIETKEGFNAILKVKELNEDYSSHFIDNLDQIILDIISKPIKFQDLMETLIKLIDTDALDFKSEFSAMIKNRIKYFITHRILYIK